MKKNLFILFAILLASTFTFAQSGKMFITGGIGFNSSSNSSTVGSTTTDVPSSSTFNINAEFHYMVTNQIAVGLGVGYYRDHQYNSTVSDNDLYNTTSLFEFAPSAIYFMKITDHLKYSPKLYVSFGFGTYDMDDYDNDNDVVVTTSTDLTNICIGLEPLSFEYSFNKHFAINMAFGSITYNMLTSSVTESGVEYKDKRSNFDLGLNMGASFGLRFYF